MGISHKLAAAYSEVANSELLENTKVSFYPDVATCRSRGCCRRVGHADAQPGESPRAHHAHSAGSGAVCFGQLTRVNTAQPWRNQECKKSCSLEKLRHIVIFLETSTIFQFFLTRSQSRALGWESPALLAGRMPLSQALSHERRCSRQGQVALPKVPTHSMVSKSAVALHAKNILEENASELNLCVFLMLFCLMQICITAIYTAAALH